MVLLWYVYDVPAFKFYIFIMIANYEIDKMNVLVLDIPTQILLTILLFINHTFRSKLKVNIGTHTKNKLFTIN